MAYPTREIPQPSTIPHTRINLRLTTYPRISFRTIFRRSDFLAVRGQPLASIPRQRRNQNNPRSPFVHHAKMSVAQKMKMASGIKSPAPKVGFLKLLYFSAGLVTGA